MAYIDELNKYAKDLYKNKDDLEVEKVKKELDAPLVFNQENRKKVIGSSTNKEGKTEYYFDDGTFVTAPNEQEAVMKADRITSKKLGSNPMISTPEMPVMGVFGETGSKEEVPDPYKDVGTESYLKKDVKESQDPYLKLINSLPKKKESSWKDIIGDALTLAVPTLVGASMDEMATGAKIGADYTLSSIKGRRERENAYENMLNKQAFEISKARAKSKTSQEWERNKELDKVGFFEDTKTGNIISMANRQAIANGTRLRPLEKGRFGQNSKGQVFDTWTGEVVKEQQIDLKDRIVDERLQIIKEYSLKGILPKNDLYLSINCIEVDCKDLDRCRCGKGGCETPIAHFEIPQLLNDYGELAVDYIGSTDRQVPFIYYTSSQAWQYHQYRKRGKFLPYVYIDITPNENNMYDCFIFNAPLIKQVSVVAIFKEPRQLEEYGCCSPIDVENMSFINNEIKKRLTEKKLRYYRQFAAPITPNDQTPK